MTQRGGLDLPCFFGPRLAWSLRRRPCLLHLPLARRIVQRAGERRPRYRSDPARCTTERCICWLRRELRAGFITPTEPSFGTYCSHGIRGLVFGSAFMASVAGEQIVVTVEVCNTGSDRGLMRPMLERLRALTGHLPGRYLADGGFGSAQDIESAHGEVVEVYCPPTQSKHGTDPYLPRRGDGAGILVWRARMGSTAGKARYKSRSICECIHARWRNWDLRQLTVRGLEKVRAVVLWYAFTNNILQGRRMASA